MDAATIPFGQGMSTTSLQLAMSMSALANRGLLLEPQLVKRVVDARGRTVEEARPRVRQRVVPENVARMVTDMLVGVTSEGGTGVEAAVDGYQVAGKTGTAQKSEHGVYNKDKWVSSFVGYAPAQRPRITIAVVLDEPMIAHQGGAVAAPAFRRIMEAALRHLGVPADRNPAAGADALARAGQAQRKLESKPVALSLDDVDMARGPALSPGEVMVPNLIGRPARLAVVQARRAMLDVTLQGAGLVSAQDPMPGSVVQRGTVLSLQLTSPGPELPAPPLGADLAARVNAQPSAADEPGEVLFAARRGQDG
jgi:cell division protein FtsI (penicillin-binding protein 3)